MSLMDSILGGGDPMSGDLFYDPVSVPFGGSGGGGGVSFGGAMNAIGGLGQQPGGQQSSLRPDPGDPLAGNAHSIVSDQPNAVGMTQAPGYQTNPQTMGQPFQLTHRNIIGRLADALSGGTGYEDRMRERDVSAAMANFGTDPLGSIKNLARVPGMAGDAVKLYDQYTTNQEKNDYRDIMTAQKKEVVYNRMGQMANSFLTAHPQGDPDAWAAMYAQMKKYASMWGMTPEDFGVSPAYSADALQGLTGGSIKTVDQIKTGQADQRLAQGDKRLEQGDKRLGIQEKGMNNTQAYRQARLGQINTAEADKNARANQAEAGRQGRFNSKQQGSKPQSIMTLHGPGIISKDGNTMMVFNGGKKYGYVKSGNANGKTNWTPVGEIKGK